MLLIDKLVEQRIKEAESQGCFDNLPGQGEPLKLDDDSLVPEELRAAYRMLKNAGFVPPEVSLRKEIRHVEQLMALTDDEEYKRKYGNRLQLLRLRLDACSPERSERLANSEYESQLNSKMNLWRE